MTCIPGQIEGSAAYSIGWSTECVHGALDFGCPSSTQPQLLDFALTKELPRRSAPSGTGRAE